MNTAITAKQSLISRIIRSEHNRVFVALWLITFALYLPTAKAGWVLDTAGWLKNIRNLSFWDYFNNSQSGIPSLYQFTQLTTYVFYKIFNANPYAWHLLMVTIHSVNGFLLFLLCKRIFNESNIEKGSTIAFAGVVLYTVCPHISEVIVWEAAYHYLQGFMLILAVMLLVQQFFKKQQLSYAWWAGIIFFCATYSLEIFYLTPLFVVTLAIYYRYVLQYDDAIFKKVIKWFVVPQLLMFALHVVVLRSVYHGQMAHLGTNIWQPFSTYVCKPPRYIFHILFFGRFFPLEIRRSVYAFVCSNAALIVFYNIFLFVCVQVVLKFRHMSNKGKVCTLLFGWVIITQGIILPLAFPDMMLLYYDRYTYFLDAFIYMLLSLGISYVTMRAIRISLLATYGSMNVFFTTKLNLNWKRSAYINNRLLKNLPDPGNKIVVMLNLPQCMNGVPMIGAEKDGAYKMMYKLFVNKDVTNKMYDVAAYNMVTKEDGAHVYVHNDSVITVTLNQWGTWWWYEQYGAPSYENEDYRLDMKDMGHWYDLYLKHPADHYLLLLHQGDQWKTVDMKKKDENQY